MRKTWEEIVTEYPDKWVVLKNVIFNEADIIEAEIVDVKSDDDIIEYQEEHFEEKYIYRRTTEGVFNGEIRANFEITIN